MQSKATHGLALLFMAATALLSLTPATSRAQQATAESAKPVAQPLGAITGRVVSAGGEPLPGATVYSNMMSATQSHSTTADAGGSFRLDGLDAGAYAVSANAPGFTVEVPPAAGDLRHFYHPGDSLTLTLVKGGVITGAVTNSTNSPVINVSVRAFRVRDANGQPVQSPSQANERLTDDRGIYRLYGLPPGSYVISAGGAGRFFGLYGSQYENDAPTYAPSSARDTAVEISVHSGEEINADIQYRGEPGHSLSGAVAGFPPLRSMSSSNALIFLTDVRNRGVIMTANASAFNSYAFAFYGVPDGEYELFAQRYALAPNDSSASEARRVKVQGGDVSGISLSLAPLAMIAGRLVLESNPPADCVKDRLTAAQETVVGARRFNLETRATARAAPQQAATIEVPISAENQVANGFPDAKGDFTVRNLHGGSYRIDAQLPGSGWYLRSIVIGTATTAAKPSERNVARDGIALKSGERANGLTVTITEGAGGLRGHISVPEGQRVPAGLRVYLVPAERDNAENVLRFFEAAADTDATFAIGNIAPGRYWIIARGADDGDPTKVKPIRQESALRARVLREAEALKKEISFKPCERSSNYDLPYSPSTAPRQ